MKIINDNTMGFYLIKHIKDIANERSMDLFSVWFVENIIIPYNKDDKVLDWICNIIGFKKVPTIDKIYYRLKEIEIK